MFVLGFSSAVVPAESCLIPNLVLQGGDYKQFMDYSKYTQGHGSQGSDYKQYMQSYGGDYSKYTQGHGSQAGSAKRVWG